METKASRDMRNLITAILKAENIDYEAWLYEKQLECLALHSNLIVKALQQKDLGKQCKQNQNQSQPIQTETTQTN